MGATAPENLRERILDKAATLFTCYGYHGLSMRQIAEAVGMSKAGLYYHFKDKEALFLAILLHNIAALGRLVREVRERGGNSRQQFRNLVEALTAGMRGKQAIIRLAGQDAQHLSSETRERLRTVYHREFIDPIATMLREGQRRGELRPFDPVQATWLLLGMTRPLLSTPPYEVAATVDLLMTLFFEGAQVCRKT